MRPRIDPANWPILAVLAWRLRTFAVWGDGRLAAENAFAEFAQLLFHSVEQRRELPRRHRVFASPPGRAVLLEGVLKLFAVARRVQELERRHVKMADVTIGIPPRRLALAQNFVTPFPALVSAAQAHVKESDRLQLRHTKEIFRICAPQHVQIGGQLYLHAII